MNYEQARKYIETVQQSGIILGLTRMEILLERVGNPQDNLKFVHIAGTNGKGSVLAYVSTIVEVAGYRVGRYISPTVEDYLERIQINRKNISPEDFCQHLSTLRVAIDEMVATGVGHPSVFEIETALGFLYFKAQQCDLVVMETGMGGAEDGTNVVKNTLACIFTSVSFDHMAYLGNSIEALTYAKAGIIKENAQVIYGALPEVSKQIINDVCQQFNLVPTVVTKEAIKLHDFSGTFKQTFDYKQLSGVSIGLLGAHQVRNATLAIECGWALREQGFNVSDESILAGLKETAWFGRLTVVQDECPTVILDGAHNEESAQALGETLKQLFAGKRIVGVMGVFKDKEVADILLGVGAVLSHLYTIDLPDENRRLSAESLATLANELGILATAVGDLAAGIKLGMVDCDVLVVFGSLSHLGMARSVVLRESI